MASIGKVSYGPTEVEKKSIQYRRSLYVVEDMKAGDVLTVDNMRAIRPGFGLPTKYCDELLGKKVIVDIKRGSPLTWTMI